ncbi:MAG: AAA family ATPase [Pirellulaceae bacterium]
MEIQRIDLLNFKLFEKFKLDLHPRFTMLVGENGSGKTSLLDALAIVCGVWLYDVPDSKIKNSSRRPLSEDYIRRVYQQRGDRSQFVEASKTAVIAEGILGAEYPTMWAEQLLSGSRHKDLLSPARDYIRGLYHRSSEGAEVLLPIVAYYGAGRAWLPHNERSRSPSRSYEPANRWAAFYDCLNERIRMADLRQWFWDETTERGNRGGKYRPGFEVVKWAILRCVPGANEIWFDVDRKDIVLSIDDNAQPMANLSAGQRTMMALVADIAIKAVTQNNHLVSSYEINLNGNEVPIVLAETPGVVLIDELDVHLHPRWQRRVVQDLKSTFPKIQFVCTTHSPQIIGELPPDEIRLLHQQGQSPRQSFGMDSNWILDVLMNSEEQNEQVQTEIARIFEQIGAGEIDAARESMQEARKRIGGTNKELERAEAMLARLKLLGK